MKKNGSKVDWEQVMILKTTVLFNCLNIYTVYIYIYAVNRLDVIQLFHVVHSFCTGRVGASET